MNANWLKVLLYWQETMLRHALSFSFLIGALKEYSNELEFKDLGSEESIRRLINKIRNTPIHDAYFHVYRCPDIGVLVIRKVNDSIPPKSSVGIASDDSSMKTYMYVSDGVSVESKDSIEDLVSSIIFESAIAIDNRTYSRNGSSFSEFSDYDVNAVKRALA